MRKSRTQAMKLLNKALATYPNMYVPLTEGIADSAVTTVADLSPSGLGDLTVETPGATQWANAVFSGWEPALNNTNQRIVLEDVSGVANNFSALFTNLQTSCWMVMLNLDYVRDDAASQNAVNVRDMSYGGVNGRVLLELRLNPAVGSSSPLIYDSDGAVMTQANSVASAENEQIWVALMDNRAGVKTSTVYRFDPGTSVHNIVSAQDKDITAGVFDGVQSVATGGGRFVIGARALAASYDKHVDTAGIKDFRFINFGLNPPTDIVKFIEELSRNHNFGTRRAY